MNRDTCEHSVPTSLACDKCSSEGLSNRVSLTQDVIRKEINNLKTIIFHLGEDKRELLEVNTRLVCAINLIKETLSGGEVQDLHQIINAAIDAHYKKNT